MRRRRLPDPAANGAEERTVPLPFPLAKQVQGAPYTSNGNLPPQRYPTQYG